MGCQGGCKFLQVRTEIRRSVKVDVMNSRFVCVAVFLASAVTASGDPGTFEIRPADGSRLELVVEKTGFMRGKKHLFRFERYEGRVQYDAQNPARSRIELAIESASASCKDTWLSAKDLKKVEDA